MTANAQYLVCQSDKELQARSGFGSKEFVLIGGNMAEEFPGGYFGGVSFERIAIMNYEVDTIHLSALISSQDTLEELEIMFSHLKEFPWDTLPLLTKLTSLKLYGNELKNIRIRSDSLRELDISSNQIAALKSGWSAPNLTSLRMDMNPISEIPHGFLDGLGNLQEFHCFECHLGPTLFKGSMGFHSEIVTYIELGRNDISNIEEGAITGVTPDTFVGLDLNKITDLTEATFRPILEVLRRGFGSLSVTGNPIICGCRIDWLVRNPFLQTSIFGSCQDGSFFRALDPHIFEQFCIER
ncbi:unnamed protein product, partial [Darwinula stevensoni]